MPIEPEPEFSQNSAFNDYMQDFLKEVIEKNKTSEKVKTEEKTWRRVKLTVPFDSGRIEHLLDSAGVFIQWLYDNNHKKRSLRDIPIDARGCLSSSTLGGILWQLGRITRPKIRPQPFILVFKKWLALEDDCIILFKEDRARLPRPVLNDGGEIRWIKVWRDRIDYFIREPCEVYNISNVFPVLCIGDEDNHHQDE